MYNEEEKLFLKWNHFQENALSAFGTLREDREFADVTLACEDGEQVEVHKVILASSSPFFFNLLRRNKHQHPIIYMRGLKSEDLVAMIDFLYFGEANVFQQNLESFLDVAEEFQLKGLMGSGAEKGAKESNKKPHPRKNVFNSVKQNCVLKPVTPDFESSYTVDQVKSSPPLEGTVAVTNFTVDADLNELNDHLQKLPFIKLATKPTKTKKKVDGDYLRCECGSLFRNQEPFARHMALCWSEQKK